MQCLRCNRKLKDKKSNERGYGPVCWEKVQEQPDLLYFSKHKELQDDLFEKDGEGNVQRTG